MEQRLGGPLPTWQQSAWSMHLAIMKARDLPAISDDEARHLTLAITGESGELANLVKKQWRGDYTMAQIREGVAEELADIMIYCFLLARTFGLDADDICRSKLRVVDSRYRAKLQRYAECLSEIESAEQD